MFASEQISNKVQFFFKIIEIILDNDSHLKKSFFLYPIPGWFWLENKITDN